MDDSVPRSELEGYVRRHEADSFAHAPMRHDLRGELLGGWAGSEQRLSALERWQQRIIGGLGMLSFLLLAGGITVVIELARK